MTTEGRGITTEPTTRTLAVPGAVLTYDMRRNDSSKAPTLFMIGSPMGAGGFSTLAGHFNDRTVVTYDPRGVERSKKKDDATESTPDQHADDLHRLISELDAGPVEIFASSGGAVNALALVAKHPEQVRTLVAHEPPAAQVLPDRAAALAACADVHETYLRDGFGPAMAKFIALAMHKGPFTPDYASGPAPDPAMFGLPTQDDGSRNDPLLAQNMISCTHYRLDFKALSGASTRIVIGSGAESAGELANRAAVIVAERLAKKPVTFPSNHAGFLGGEYGQRGDPDAFATTLRRVLTTKD
jgi:pimeloyl-ACP methyl ester carboxylesterase